MSRKDNLLEQSLHGCSLWYYFSNKIFGAINQRDERNVFRWLVASLYTGYKKRLDAGNGCPFGERELLC